jgi:hypothetical protein
MTHSCAGCAFFDDRPARLEQCLPGIVPLSSAYAASRTGDGLCLSHDRLVAATASCRQFKARMFFSEEKNQKTFGSAPLASYQAMAG